MAARLCLVDGSGFIFRAYHALPPLTRGDGTPVGAVMGFCNMVARLIETHAGDRIAIVFDTARVSFRNEFYPEYKAHRPDPPEDLKPQFAIVREATRAFDLPAIELAGFEADDLIATYARLAREAGEEVIIVSSDKDLMQLVRPGVAMLDPLKQKTIGEAEVFDKFGVKPDRVVDVQALAGDSTDNVPGVPGIGVKTAAELINLYGDLETLLARAGEIKQPKRRESLLANAELARVSRRLVLLRDDAPVPVPLAELTLKTPDPEKLRTFLSAQGFRSLLGRLDALASAPRGTSSTAAAPAAVSAPAPAPTAPASDVEQRYTLVRDAATLEEWVARARGAGVCAIDTETTSLDARNAKLVGVSLAIEPGEACYIPVGHVAPGTQAAVGGLDFAGSIQRVEGQIALEDAVRILGPLLADPATLKIGHNFKYDLHVFAGCGLTRVASIDDTMLISYVLEGGRHGHGMDELAALHLGHKTISYDEVTGTGKARISFAEVPLDKALAYAAEDADITRRLHRALKPRLAEQSLLTVYETIERPLIAPVVAMEEAGIGVDRAALQRLSNE
ncbi:MAG: 5'-3' exonuclease H3TH domain-containing protein, partial [Rhodospirillales bacterium]